MTEEQNSVVRTRPMRLSETHQVPSGRKTTKKTQTNPKTPPNICREKNSGPDCSATQSCDSERLLPFTDVSFSFWNNNHTCQRDLRHTSSKI